jgi:ubiquinone/menaquinone biosynthesis C-methylase UbiE
LLTSILGRLTASSPQLKRSLWKQWYEFLAGRFGHEDWTFMNYGYADPAEADGRVRGVTLDPADEADRCSIQLYHQVAAAVELRGRDVLEVGSGRGGGCSYIARYLQPRAILGVDYSDNAVSLSRERHSAPGLTFQQGDAENLPCADASFDAVLNVESSHCYGSMDRFVGEVARVLRPDGHFLWADMRPRGKFDEVREQFHRAGLEMGEAVNITPNVVHGLDRINDKKRAMISRHVPRFLVPHFEDFAGVSGKRVYNSLKAGEVEYWRCVAQKRASG